LIGTNYRQSEVKILLLLRACPIGANGLCSFKDTNGGFLDSVANLKQALEAVNFNFDDFALADVFPDPSFSDPLFDREPDINFSFPQEQIEEIKIWTNSLFNDHTPDLVFVFGHEATIALSNVDYFKIRRKSNAYRETKNLEEVPKVTTGEWLVNPPPIYAYYHPSRKYAPIFQQYVSVFQTQLQSQYEIIKSKKNPEVNRLIAVVDGLTIDHE
jgi:hypothetical protein